MKNASYDEVRIPTNQTMAGRTLVPYGSDRAGLLHSFLYSFFCPTGIPLFQRGDEGSAMGRALRIGKDVPVWWPDHTGCGRIQTPQGEVQKLTLTVPYMPRRG